MAAGVGVVMPILHSGARGCSAGLPRPSASSADPPPCVLPPQEITERETARVLKENKALGAAVKAITFKHLTFGEAPFRVEGESTQPHKCCDTA